jgi:hypothetical protein
MTTQISRPSRVLSAELRHGSQVLPDDAPGAEELAGQRARVSLDTQAVPGADVDAPGVTSSFGYLFQQLADEFPAHHLPGDPATVTSALKDLGAAVVETRPAEGAPAQPLDATIPGVYTYWGQFIDHDITANTDRKNAITDVTREPLIPLMPADVVRDLKNLRQPSLNLDSVYGDGPFAAPDPTLPGPAYDGIALRVGEVAQKNNDGSDLPGVPVPGPDDRNHDLPRNGSVPLIGDGRNDENLIVAQFHVAMLRFHNAVLAWVRENEGPYSDEQAFERTRDLVRWHYQWLVVHDYLETIALPGIVDKVLLTTPRHFTPPDGETYMPLEFSAAAYRFGHSMVRNGYDFNRNFGKNDGGPGLVLPFAPFNLIFAFTGGAQPEPFAGRTTVLPFNWVIEWDRMVHKGDSDPTHFARKIDTKLAPALSDMINQITPQEQLPPALEAILKSLAVRNLLRGYQLALPTGQAVAGALGVAPLTEAELQQGNSDEVNAALAAGGFLQNTPLWFYVLREAEVRANGNSLGEVGSRIVVETLIGQLLADPDSYLQRGSGWTPMFGAMPADGEPIVTIADLFRFAGLAA